MSDPENFLARWSRRKREVEQHEAEEAEVPAAANTSGAPSGQDSAEAVSTAGANAPATESETFDPTKLPPLESITAETDISGYFARGVPADLVSAALRRVWTSDPTIRDFIGLSENAWDFNAPETIPGFGPITASDDVAGMMRQLMGEAREMVEQTGPEPNRLASPQVPDVPEHLPHSADPAKSQGRVADAETVLPPERPEREDLASHDAADEALSVAEATEPKREVSDRPRGHGSALPK